MNKKVSIRDVEAGMKFKVTTPTELNFYGVFKVNKNNKVEGRMLEEGEILTALKVINNNQVVFKKENGDRFVAFWNVFKDETVPHFDTTEVLNKNTVAYYLKDNKLDKLDFKVVKKEFATHRSNRKYPREYPVILGVRYEYGMRSSFNLDVIKAYKVKENIEIYEGIILNKLKENWEEVRPLTKNKNNNTKIKILTRRKKVIMEISELPYEFDEAVIQVREVIRKYKEDTKTHIIVE